MNDEQKVREAFEAWADDYGLRQEPNYSAHTEYDCWSAWQAALSHASATAEECSVVGEVVAKLAAFRNRFISERTTTWLRDGLNYEMARAKAEADANEYEQAFDQAIAGKRVGK